jgi:outer membrane protein assembly factor BamB
MRCIPLALLLTAQTMLGCDMTQAPAERAAHRQASSTPPSCPIAVSSVNDWPCWRGPGARAVALGTRLPNPWPQDEPRSSWEYSLGTGWSSPIVANQRVFVTDRQGSEERLLALDSRTGQLLWQRTNPVDFEPHSVGVRHGNGPKATPVVQANRVYSLGIAGHLQCVDAQTGAVIWKRLLPADFAEQVPLPAGKAFVKGTESVVVPTGAGQGGAVPLFGYTGSPLWIDGRLILSVGGQRGGTIMAFDAASGDVLWKALHENVSYSSPAPAVLAGVAQVVVMTGPRVVGLRLSDGELLWSHPFQIQYDESISTPAIGDDQVLVTADGKPLTSLRIERHGDQWIKTVAWQNYDLSSYLSSMLVYSGHVYGMADDGRFACVRLADGKTLWQGGDHGYYCSPILAEDRLLCLNEKGNLLVLAANPAAYRELGRSRLARGETWTMPAVVDSRLFIRSADRIACYDLRP